MSRIPRRWEDSRSSRKNPVAQGWGELRQYLRNSVYLSHIPLHPTKNSRCIIMLHGVWSNESDLFWLKDQFHEDDYIFSLQWPFHLGSARYAWYRVDFSTGKPVYEIDDVMTGYSYITDCIKDITAKYQLSPEQIYLMGFSQWAIMSYYTLSRSPELIAWVIWLSGRILPEIDTSSMDFDSFVWKRIFIWHGTEDQIISVRESDRAVEFARSMGIEPSLHIYSAPHTITGDEIGDIVEWIKM